MRKGEGMIIYKNTTQGFKQDVNDNRIVTDIEQHFLSILNRHVSNSEKNALNNSLRFMESLVRTAELREDCGVLIEYNIPSTSKRVDFILTGEDMDMNKNLVMIELKQWSAVKGTNASFLVETYTGGANREVPHPSYQAYSYQRYLTDLNEEIFQERVFAHSCAYLHNYIPSNPEPLLAKKFLSLVAETPCYFSNDVAELRAFIKKYVGNGKGMDILFQVDKGKIRPSKKLIDAVSGIFKRVQEFTLLDEQRVAFDKIIEFATRRDRKRTIIVVGGPGTGKSVVSINSLVDLLNKGLNIRFIAPNAAFRKAIVDTLSQDDIMNQASLGLLFSGSGRFYNALPNEFDVLVVDEAHRLKGKGAYMYKGTNQIEDVVKASRTNVFFIDDYQKIRPDDIGSVDEIRRIANRYNSEIFEIVLEAQFRCSGAEGYMNWIDNTLRIKETANFDGWNSSEFEFKICKTPNEVNEKIIEMQNKGFKARLLAGYAWKWTSQTQGNGNAEIKDVSIIEHNFEMPWNTRLASSNWAMDPKGINQVGCIHTSQGLEFDYVGILIGNDLKYNPKTYELFASYSDYFDSTGKSGLSNDNQRLTNYIKNIYRVLLTRGIKGCFVYCRDKNLEEYLRDSLKN